MTARARVRVESVGGRQLRAALTGARRELQRFEKEVRREGAQTTRTTEQQERKKGRSRKQHIDEAMRDARRLADALERLEKESTREFEKQSRTRERRAKQESRQRRRAAERASPLRRAGQAAALAGGAVVGGAMAAYNRTSAVAGSLGARSREQLVADAAGFERNLQGLATRRGIDSNGTEALRGQINAVSQSSGIGQDEILAGLAQAQSRFADQFDMFANQLPEMARAAQASGARLEDVITFLGNVGRANPNMSEEELKSVMLTAVDVGNRGSVEFGALATAFGTIPGEFSRGMQTQGPEGVRQMLEVAQMMAAGGSTDSESATMLARTMQRLNRVEVQNKFKRMTGEEITNEDGALRPLMEIVGVMKENGMASPQKMQELLGADIMSARGLGILMGAAGNEDFRSNVGGASAEGGQSFIEDYFNRLESSGAMAAGNVGIDQMAEFQRQGGIQSDAARQVIDRVKTQVELETKYWEVIDALDTFKGALMAVGGLAVGGKLLGLAGGGAAAAGGGGGAIAGALGGAGGAVNAAGAAGGMGGALATGGGVLAAGAAGYGLGTLIDDWAIAGEGKLSDKIGEFAADQHGVGVQSEETTSVRGLVGANDPRATTEGLSIKEDVQNRLAMKIGGEVSNAFSFLGRDLSGGLAAIIEAQVRRYDGGPSRR